MGFNSLQSKIVGTLFLILLLCGGGALSKSKLPVSSIYIADVKIVNDSLVIGKPTKITSWKGYNDQPSFLLDGKSLMYTSVRTKSHAEIFRYDIAKKTTTKITNTKESEYSAQVVPGGSYYSVVRVEKDSSQRLWLMPLRKGLKPHLIMEDIKMVAYYAWLDALTGAMVVLEKGDGNTLRTFNMFDSSNNVLRGDVGRCIKKVPQKGGLSFVEKTSDTAWYVKVYDFGSKRVFDVLKTFPGSEDFTWTRWDDIIMGYGAKLFICRPPEEKNWKELADFSKLGITKITRIAVSEQNDKIAFVVEEK